MFSPLLWFLDRDAPGWWAYALFWGWWWYGSARDGQTGEDELCGGSERSLLTHGGQGEPQSPLQTLYTPNTEKWLCGV